MHEERPVGATTDRPDGRSVVAPTGRLADELAFAHHLADVAAAITTRGGHRPRVRRKADQTPVTDVDVEVEGALRAEVAGRFPSDAFLGEEGGRSGTAPRTWIVDPIDGTRNFVDDIQLWATLIALEVDGTTEVAVVDAPLLRERYDAVRGAGARLNGAPIAVSGVSGLERSFVLHSGIEEWVRDPRWNRFVRLVGGSARSRGLSDFWGHVLVARGSAEVLLEHEPCGVWDWAALRLIVEEAGGRMTTLEGDEPSHLCSLVSSNGLVHDEVLSSLGVEDTTGLTQWWR
jgi:histidinol-phosphatase